MATVQEGAKGALVVVDVQHGVVGGAWEADRVVGIVADLNRVMQWVDYADVSNTTATAEALDLSALA